MKVLHLFCLFYFLLSVYATGETPFIKCDRHIRNLMEWVNLPATFIEGARYNNPEDSMTKSLQEMMSKSSENIMKEQLAFTNECAQATGLTDTDHAMLATPVNGLFQQIFLLYQNLKKHQAELKQNPELETVTKELLTSTKSMLDFYLNWKVSYRVPNYFMIAFRLMQDRDNINRDFGML